MIAKEKREKRGVKSLLLTVIMISCFIVKDKDLITISR